MKLPLFILIAICAGIAVASGSAEATAVGAPPTWPIPADAAAGPPPIPTLPAAGEAAPPADQIADPVRPAATCGGWYLQSSYAGRWQAGSSWWEYQCNSSDYQYHSTCSGGACDQWCPYCWSETQEWTDYFYWDGSNAVFYGQLYSDSVIYDYQYDDGSPPYATASWWDGPTAQWYLLNAHPLSVSKQGSGSGTVTSSPAGISCGSACHEIVDAGTPVTLTATADMSSVFTGWSGDCSGTGACAVTMDQARSVTATFERQRFTLSVATAGTGSGLVYMSPGATGCRSCQQSFDIGTTVTLTAYPDPSSVFTGWSGDCSGSGSCQVTMDQARSVTATFSLSTFNLAVAKAGTGSGTVTSSPPGISCGVSCQASFAAGTAVTLTATADAGSLFSGWSGDCSGTGSCQVTIDRARSVTATFAPNAPPRASFTVTCAGLTCTFDGSGSADPEGSSVTYAWNFGDGASVSGGDWKPSRTYGRPGSYTVTLSVTDNAGATGSDSKAINPISLSARGYKQKGLAKVDLAWSGTSSASFDVYRNGARIATVEGTSYADNINKTGSATYTYKVCEPAASTCSNEVRVAF
jgi:PKD domain/Divergent InlB B-repeat domain